MGKNMAQRQKELHTEYFKAGLNTGQQYAADCFALAMQEAGISRPKIIEIFRSANELENENMGLLDANRKRNADCDWERERMDTRMLEIFGELFSPWDERYPFITKA